MAETTIYLNDNYNVSSSTNTVVNYVATTIEAAKSDIVQDLRPEINDIVDEKIASLDINPDRFSLTNHSHSQYALVSETYSKQETDLKIETSIPDLSPYATKDELQNYSTVSHQHSDYALADDVYTKNETENLVNSHTPDLSDYYNKSQTDNLISGFKNITFLTTDEYNNLDPKEETVLYVLTDSEETPIDLSQYVTIEQLNARGYKTIQYISTADYEALDPKSPDVLYILTDSQEETIDLTGFYTKSETDNLISGFKNIEYLTTEAYNNLDPKEEDVLYILTDSQEEEIDLSSYVTNDELNAKGFKKIEYISTASYEALDPKEPDVLYILTDSTEEQIDLSQYVTKDELNAKGYKAITYISTSEYKSLDPKSPDVLYILTDSQEPTIDLSSYALNSSLSEHINDASAHFTAEEREAYDNFSAQYYVDDAWDITPMAVFQEFLSSDWSTAMGQFDTRIANNDSSISAIKSRLNEFSLTNHTHDSYVLKSSLSDNYYNKTQTDEKLAEKANICVLDIYAIESGDVTVTEEMWNEWMECLTNHGIFYQDNGDVRLTLEVFGGDERSSIGFVVVENGYSYSLIISKEDDGKGNISFSVNTPNEYFTVYNIDDINEWDNDKWNYVIGNLDSSTIFKLGGIPLSISYDGNNKLIISTVEEGAVKVYTVTRAETRSAEPGSYTYTVNEEEQYEVEVIDDLSTWDDDKWNLVSKNSNGVKLFEYENKPLNVSENKEGQLLLSYLDNGTALRVVTVTQVATKAAVGNTYTVETNNFYIDDIENKQDKLNYYTEDVESFAATIAMSSEEGDSGHETTMTADNQGLYINNDSSYIEHKKTAELVVYADNGIGLYHDAEFTEEDPDYGATTAHSWIDIYNESICLDVALGDKNNIFNIDPSAVTINDDRVLTETDLDDFYTKSYIDTSLNNVYTKSYIDTSLNNVYTKSYIDTSLNNVYTKSEIDTMIGSIETSLASI